MRDFLYSKITQIELISNIPDNLALAEQVGSLICKTVC